MTTGTPPDASGLGDNAAIPVPDTAAIAAREHRRVRRWTIATGSLWLLAAAYLVALWWSYMVFVHPALHDSALREHPDPARIRGMMQALLYVLDAYLACRCCSCWRPAAPPG